MSLTTLVVVVQLCLETFTFVTLSSAVTSVNAANSIPASSIVTTSIGTTTASTSSEISPKSPSASTTTSSANATASKPAQDKKLIASIPTFDFSLPNKVPEPKVVNTCHSKDMCKKLTGVCIHGICVPKKCSMDFYCNCDKDYTGQFCDKNLTEIVIKNGKANGNHETTPTNNSTNKELVNEKSTTPKSKELLNGKSKTTAVKELATDKLTTAPKKKDLANGMSTVKTKTKVLVNGHIDYNLINSKRGNLNNGQYNKSKKSSDNGKRTESQSKHRSGYNGIGKNKNGKSNEKVSSDDKKSDGNTENASRHVASESKRVTSNGSKSNWSQGKKMKRIRKVKRKPSKESVHTTASSEKYVKDIFSGKPVLAKKNFKKSLDGSYLKGPEVHVLSDHSVVDIKAPRKDIDKGKRSLVNKQTDTVTITATSVEQTQLGVAPEMLSSVARNSLKTNKKKTSKIDTESSQQTGNSEIKTETNVSKASMKNIPKVSQEKTDSITVKEKPQTENTTVKVKPQTIVSTVDIAKRNPVLVTEEAGSVSIPNNTVIEVSPLFANSEIKITIETSNADRPVNNDNVSQTSAVLTARNDSDSPKDRSKKIVQNKGSNGLDRTENTDPKQANAEMQSKAVRKDSTKLQSGTVEKNYKGVTALQKTTSTDKPAGKRVGASKKSETRKSTKSEMLNPIMQLMNIFRSRKFVENVSAVKIEIITKQNSTDVQKPNDLKTERKRNN